jgi:hypothetical protein
MSLILQWFRKGSLGATHNLLAIYSRDILKMHRAVELDLA